MAIIDIKEDSTKLSASSTSSKFTLIRGFTVKFDNEDAPYSRPQLCLGATDGITTIPSRGDAHPDNLFLPADNVNVKPSGESAFLFNVTVTYTSEMVESSAVPVTPWEEPSVLKWGSITSNEVIDSYYDANDNALPILNSAGEPPDPPITEDVIDTTLAITHNSLEFNSNEAAEYKGKINEDIFYGKAAKTVLCKRYDAEEAYFGNQLYFKITKEFHIRVDGWTRNILDQGFRVSTGSNVLTISTTAKRIVDTEGSPISEPSLLNGLGGLLSPAADPVYLERNTKKSKTFAGLVPA